MPRHDAIFTDDEFIDRRTIQKAMMNHSTQSLILLHHIGNGCLSRTAGRGTGDLGLVMNKKPARFRYSVLRQATRHVLRLGVSPHLQWFSPRPLLRLRVWTRWGKLPKSTCSGRRQADQGWQHWWGDQWDQLIIAVPTADQAIQTV